LIDKNLVFSLFRVIMVNVLAGLKIGHATNPEFHTGCTVFLCPPGSVGGVDVRGPAPGSRETVLLAPDKSVTTINAILLTGGSAFGLSAADGVMRYLAENGIGHPTPIRPIPIVAAAVVYDLFLGGGRVLPDAEMGYAACLAASADPPAQGNVGAGTGVTVGKWGGFEGIMMGGFGLASLAVKDLVVSAAAVVNSVGDVVNSDGTVLAGARKAGGGWLVEEDPLRRFPERPPANLVTNTTLVVVMTNARLDKVGANRLAQRAHDGLAIAVRPVHTTHDGDTAFALSTGQIEVPFDLVANAAVDVVAEAIRNGVRFARTRAGIVGLEEEENN
jgi:L-aminopeptidase/D-esterase-like protein